jgi:valyl-tRNA synthetase
MAYIETLTIAKTPQKHDECATAFIDGLEIVLSLKDLVDTEKVRKNYQKDLAEIEQYITSLHAKLSNEAFIARARAEIIAQEREKLKIAEEKAQYLQKALEEIDKK